MRSVAFALCLLALAAVQAKRRTNRLPAALRKRAEFRHPPDERIVGGSEVSPNSIPHQVSYQYRSDGFHFCAGSIYDATHVITAAHCCKAVSANRAQIVAGEHNLFEDSGDEQTVHVKHNHIHEHYNANTMTNDICLLELSAPLEMNSKVAGVAMPGQDAEFTGAAVVSGWGTLSSGGSSPDVLMAVTVPIVSDDDCRDAYGQNDIKDTMICAGEEGKDSCQGDSGGPMTCSGMHCGVVSWGYGCAAAGFPGVYTQTSNYVDWVATTAAGSR